MMKQKRYIQASLLALSGLFLWYAFATATPMALLQTAGSMFASAQVSTSASVPPNPYNTLAQQLATKEAELDEREKQMRYFDTVNAGTPDANTLALASFGMSFALLVLVAANFYMDWRRVQV